MKNRLISATIYKLCYKASCEPTQLASEDRKGKKPYFGGERHP